jgi:hypothetical protein
VRKDPENYALLFAPLVAVRITANAKFACVTVKPGAPSPGLGTAMQDEKRGAIVKIRYLKVFRGAVLLVPMFMLPQFCHASIHARHVVGNNPAQCPHAQFTKIQDAVTAAAPGDEIFICNGIYPEQVTINKSLDVDADTGVFLVPPAMQQNTLSLATGDAVAAAVLVSGAANVSISGLTVDGINNGIAGCAPRLIGVYFQNSSGNLRHAAVRNFKLGVAFNGCQSGSGVFVESGSGGISNVEIADCSIHDFQKNGVTANEAGTEVQIHNNVVTGLGPTTGAAQNGIQIGFTAAGSIRENIVTNNIWSPCAAVATCQTVATNILITQSDGVRVSDNTVGISQVGIFVDASHATVTGNTAFAASVFEDIRIEGDHNRIAENQVVNGGEADIFLQGNNNSVEHNSLTEAPIGILEVHGSTGNVIAGNEFFNVAVKIQDPAGSSLSKKVLPER